MFPRHATDVISLVAGTIFAGFTAVWILTLSGAIEADRAWIGGPVIMMAAGVIGLAAALLPRRRDTMVSPPASRPAEPDGEASAPDLNETPPESQTATSPDQAAGRPD